MKRLYSEPRAVAFTSIFVRLVDGENDFAVSWKKCVVVEKNNGKKKKEEEEEERDP
jgi:hypothetical protein